MKYQVGQMLKFVGPTEPVLHHGSVGTVMPPDRTTRFARMMTGAAYYTMNFPGYNCSCGEHHYCSVHEDVLKPIDDPDEADERITEEELDEELS